MNKFLKEPLVHFLLIGFALFAFYANMNENIETDSENTIHITSANLKELSQKFEDAKGHLPNKKEKKKLLDKFIQDEVLYLEALKKDLDKNDATIKDHLAKKMKYVLDDLTMIKKPSEKELLKYLSENSELFKEKAFISFNQVMFKYDGKKDIKKEAINFLTKLKSKKSPKIANVGDLIEISKEKLTQSLNKQMVDNMFEVKTKEWTGPFSSKHGLHLVYVHSRFVGGTPDLSLIKDKVETAWIKEEQDKANQVFYKKLQDNYEITID